MSSTTANASNMRPLSLNELRRVKGEVRDLFPPGQMQWTLIAPDGRVWQGDVQHIFMALAPHHPLLKIGGGA